MFRNGGKKMLILGVLIIALFMYLLYALVHPEQL